MKSKLLGMFLAFVLVVALLPMYAFASDDYHIAIAASENQATITGGSSAYAGKTITLRLVDSSSRNILADEVKAETNGSFSFGPYTLADGSYNAYVGGVDMPESKPFTVSSAVTQETDTSTSGDGGSGDSAANSGTIIASIGGTLTLNGVQINVPAGAIDRTIRVTVDQVSDTSSLPADATLKLVSGVYEIKKDKDGDFTKPVVITLPFDKTKVDFKKSTVGVYWLNEQTRKWTQLDDMKVDQNKAIASGTVNHFTKFAVLSADKAASTQPVAEFTDIKGHWAEASIRELVTLGAVNGYPDNTFKPENSITRAEFVTIIVKAFHLKVQDSKSFADTSNHWAYREIATAAAHGVVNGYDDNTFGPDDLITREQMATIVTRAAQINLADNPVSFTDGSDISDWARTALATAAAKGLITGYEDGTVKPKTNSTRAEAVTVILRALQLSVDG